MDETKALEILKGVIFISRVGGEDSAPWVSETGTVGVDADLNREQLQALLFFIDKKYPPTQEQPKMDELEATRILAACDSFIGQEKDQLYIHRGEVFLDGRFNIEQLRALLFYLEKDALSKQPTEQVKMDEQIIDNSNQRVPSGLYEHYKRGRFIVLGVAKNCKTEEEVVVFYNEFNLKALWVRPIEEFLATVELNGEQVPRFVKLDTIRPASEVLRG